MPRKMVTKTSYEAGALVPVWLSKETQGALVEICTNDKVSLDDVVNYAIHSLWSKHQEEMKQELLALRKSPSKLVH
jgi:hypothetical protein